MVQQLESLNGWNFLIPSNLYVSTILGSLHAIFILQDNLEIICGVYVVYKVYTLLGTITFFLYCLEMAKSAKNLVIRTDNKFQLSIGELFLIQFIYQHNGTYRIKGKVLIEQLCCPFHKHSRSAASATGLYMNVS